MEKLLFEFLIMLLLWYSNYKIKESIWLSSSWLIGIYLFSALCGIGWLMLGSYRMPYTSEFWEPMLVFIFTLGLFLLPFLTFKENEIHRIILPRQDLLDLISTTIIILSFYSIIWYSSTVIKIFSSGDLSWLRNARYSNGGEEYFESGIFNTIASVSASLYVFALLFFFIYTCMGKYKTRRMLLLLASMSEPIHVLAFVGRDGIVFWIFSFIFLFLIFRPYLSSVTTKKIKRFSVVIICVLLLPFLAITVSRFGEREVGSGGSMVRYMGEGFINGPLYFSIEEPPSNPFGPFPLLREIFGIKSPDRVLLEIGEWKSWTFSTFLCSFRSVFGFWGMYLACILFLLLFYLTVGRCRKVIRMHNIIIYILYFQIYSQGVFYFRHCTRGGNLFIVLCWIMYLYFSLLSLKGGIVLKKIK